MAGRLVSRTAGVMPRLLGRRMQSNWSPVVPKGKLPVYDEALAFIEADSKVQRELRDIAKEQQGSSKELIYAHEVASELNLPEVRNQFLAGEADLSKPVFRHLREQAWRLGGSLDQLIERATLMHVLPDVVPEITFEADLQVKFGSGDGVGDHGGQGGDILAGVHLPTSLTRQAPQITATVFHTETRNYTLMLVDPDKPSLENDSFETYIHWLVQDIPISATQSQLPMTTKEVLPYIPPHPQQGTPYHRYTMLLFEQSDTSLLNTAARTMINVAQFATTHNLQLRGLHFWREQWSKENQSSVSEVYRDVLKEDEPRYGYEPRQDKLKDAFGVRHSKYY
ncbi:mitochondrial 54S ribosomal protein YmL35 [Malassezia psittaci]|uniref:Mitochondrial 54S ribosomal protein YmL35 n=1 Tax=Malassezia psittaci TaxID=1821823 RepID=A0AAF0JDL7_9BASI|nr:mitochondrial 54S ribosomal protein YmL35 [Malassezia psittaci]